MSSEITSTNMNAVGARAAVVRNLKTLKVPEEGGTKKDFDEFLEKIQSHVTISWESGKDIAFVIKHHKDPIIKEPSDMTSEEEKIKWKVRLWNQEVDKYGERINMLNENKNALYALMTEGVSKIIKSKLRGKLGYVEADENNNVIWLIGNLEDIMVNFEEVKPKILAIDDQMERIMRMKQGDQNNEDFVKSVIKELKVYEKHGGGDFLWGNSQEKKLKNKIEKVKSEYQIENGSEITDEKLKEK